MKQREQKLTKLKEKVGSKATAQKKQQEKRAAAFVPPQESNEKKISESSTKAKDSVDISKLKMRVKNMKKQTQK